MTYPHTRVVEATETLAGVSFPDPYRWLEDDTEEVRSWQRAQRELADAWVLQWPHYERLREMVAHLHVDHRPVLPRFAGGHWFRVHLPRGAGQAQALVADEPMGAGRVLFDPTTECPERPPFLSWISPSPDGRTLALGVCADGSEQNMIRLVDVATGALLDDPPRHVVMDAWTGGVHWLPDSSGFFFAGLTGTALDGEQVVYLHRRSPQVSTVRVDGPAWSQERHWRTVLIAPQGRYAVAVERVLTPIPLAIAELTDEPLRWRPFVTSVPGTLAGHIIGNEYIAVTDVDAPRGRLVAIDLDAEDPNDPGCWRELVAESDAVIRSVTPVGDLLYLKEFVDTYARVRIVDTAGAAHGQVPLPGRGALVDRLPLTSLIPQGHPDQFVFGYSSLTTSWGIYRHLPGHTDIQTLAEPRVQLDDVYVEDRWAVSADGTRVPYHVLRRTDLAVDHPRPALIFGYGGYNTPWVPEFPGAMAALALSGGLFVHAHLRGGGEFGLEWWHGGRLRNKQNCFQDLYALAEDLIAAGLSTPRSLAVTGLSNGGLLAGVAVTQRPDLWAAVIPRVPVLDLINCRDGYSRAATSLEYADIDDPDEVHRLATFSPYHLVRDHTAYPAVFLEAGETDPRCPAWHASKFAARLQAATASDAPILLRVWDNAGHGGATDQNTVMAQHTHWLAFALCRLGLTPPDPSDTVISS
ncbi:MAG: S9 family peptidase [Kutzneria sp.]|nr:S9 family peptidase [Kutzneria sp.]